MQLKTYKKPFEVPFSVIIITPKEVHTRAVIKKKKNSVKRKDVHYGNLLEPNKKFAFLNKWVPFKYFTTFVAELEYFVIRLCRFQISGKQN
ncbi:hypothetical protein EGR_08595 [Echinococcus granulosus]|uniref:Uncharacterized protein n=1 Tax=Echinococcus granulosus TaxID=6210 RepID=W6UT52_ECHGR|nr:hypothetical protein EGR_08595 [Echinococcus granulosus]EUB56569.1 hypothetical protein EGR_08595 [Echinococcus granulosus]